MEWSDRPGEADIEVDEEKRKQPDDMPLAGRTSTSTLVQELTLPSPAVESSDPDLLVALNRNAGTDAQAAAMHGDALERLFMHARGDGNSSWRGRYAKQARSIHLPMTAVSSRLCAK